MEETPVTIDELRTKQMTKEDEYFQRKELDRQQKVKAKKAKEKAEEEKKKAAEEKKKLKELHYMHCPKCGCDLKEEKYGNIAVDRCTSCKGIWFDHGELAEAALTTLKKRAKNKIKSLFGLLK